MAFKDLHQGIAELFEEANAVEQRFAEGAAIADQHHRRKRLEWHYAQEKREQFLSKTLRRKTYVLRLDPAVTCRLCRLECYSHSQLLTHWNEAHSVETKLYARDRLRRVQMNKDECRRQGRLMKRVQRTMANYQPIDLTRYSQGEAVACRLCRLEYGTPHGLDTHWRIRHR